MEIREENGLRILRPAEGMFLTDGEVATSVAVYLGANADTAAWREITPAEAEAILAEREAE